MTTSRVLQLQHYRTRRDRRYEQALALYGADAERRSLLGHLWGATLVAGGDRAAVLWVDEYGPGLVHGHVILDLFSDQPRREFPAEPLRESWGGGVPGLFDGSDADLASRGLESPLHRNVCAVALGSDGLRAWFMVVDGMTPRTRLSQASLGRLLFLAGQCSAVLMHRDMRSAEETCLLPEGGRERFAAWPILKDIEGYENDEEMNRRISLRFLVTRVIRAILDDDLSTDSEALSHQIKCVRRELGKNFRRDAERMAWEKVLSAAAGHELEVLPGAVLEVGVQVEELGHLSGALELYRSAYEISMGVGSEAVAMDAARFAGRVSRRKTLWERAMAWYTVARSLAQSVGDKGKEAAILTGIANAHRDKGNFPRARAVMQEALTIATESGDRYALGTAYHQLMSLSFSVNAFSDAIRNGWLAVRHYERDQDQLQALTALAGVFAGAGELGAAENAYAVVAKRVEKFEYRLYALSGFANTAALKGDRMEYERRLSVLEHAGFERGPAAFKAEAWLERGRAFETFGDKRAARKCYKDAISIAQQHKVGKFLIEAEEALQALNEKQSSCATKAELPAGLSFDGLEEIREELGQMRLRSPAYAGV